MLSLLLFVMTAFASSTFETEMKHGTVLFKELIQPCLSSESKVEFRTGWIKVTEEPACSEELKSLAKIWNKMGKDDTVVSIYASNKNKKLIRKAVRGRYPQLTNDQYIALQVMEACPCMVFRGTKSDEVRRFISHLNLDRK